MCGIAGIFTKQTDSESAEVLDWMLRAIEHRGPDEEGRLVDGPLAMGMRRLSIIDLADGSQPIFDESGRYAVIFNGEIYNYRELRQQLLASGHQLRTHSDTETIVHLFEEYGFACVDHLRGMFGIAIWDRQQQELFIARDRIGIKPLYYSAIEQGFIFASEIKSILMHPAIKREVDLQALSHYLSLKYVPAPRTMFAGIHSLEPGHWLRIRDGQVIQKKRYWDVSFAKAEEANRKGQALKSDSDYADELLAELQQSVNLHLRSDVPFGAFLSGGLDSSTIVALMAQQLSSPVKTFSVGFDGEGLQDELPYANQVAEAFGCEHHVLKIGVRDFQELADTVLWHLDQPLADQATIATYMVAKLARQHVKMVLTGEGGDELFAGYARYGGERYSKYTNWIPGPLRHVTRLASDRLPGLRRAKIGINALMISDEATRFANWFPMFKDDLKPALLNGPLSKYQAGCGPLFAEHLANCDATDAVDRMLYVDGKLYLVDHLLLRGDKLTMANSLEARVPLLDHKLVEFAAGLPARMKLRGKQRKFLLKAVGRRLLPSQIIDRKKQGFPIPIDHWLRGEVAPMMRELLSEDVVRRRGYFNPHYVDRLIKQHVSGYADHATELWGLMSFEMWLRSFIDPSFSSLRQRVVASRNAIANQRLAIV
ncbi:MAG: asparagine synthase (glutamine-hydrolyzing) [Planctomycetaceae bacterium]|nr:asparagine synthase (glutamine-hydrolyzing) [Planctomycetaceae bacterium]